MTDLTHVRSAPFLRRFWIYQRERFPLAAHGLSVAAFTAAVVACGQSLGGAKVVSNWMAYGVAGLVLFGQFFLLRVADEFKDMRTDARFRPERPVPRGVIGLHELARLAGAVAILQFVGVLLFDIRLLVVLGLLWFWFGFMSVEFFAGEWLRRRPLLYMTSHMMIMPLMALFALAAGAAEEVAYLSAILSAKAAWIICGLSFAAGVLLEIGRKIKAPEEERPGVETYTTLWGRRRALSLWLLAAITTALLALWAVSLEGSWLTAGAVAGSGLLVVMALAALHISRPRPSISSAIESFSGLWVLALLLTLFLSHV